MAYQTNSERINNFYQKVILPYVQSKNDLDYYKTISEMASHLKCSPNLIEKFLNSQISSGKLKEVRILTISDEGISNFLENLIQEEKEIKKEIIEVLDNAK